MVGWKNKEKQDKNKINLSIGNLLFLEEEKEGIIYGYRDKNER